MRTINFANTIRRVFAIRNNVAAIVTGKHSSHNSSWHVRQAGSRNRPILAQAASASYVLGREPWLPCWRTWKQKPTTPTPR